MPKKIIVHDKICCYPIESTNVRDLIEELQEYVDEYGSTLYLEKEYDYESYTYYLLYSREETDKEYNQRMKKNKKEKENKALAAEKRIEKLEAELKRLKSTNKK